MKKQMKIQRTPKPLIAALLLALPLAGMAATPDAGSILQQIKPSIPATPAPNETGLKIEQPAAATLPQTVPFMVTSIRITGNTLFDEATLQLLVMDAEGKKFTLDELGKLAARITDYYRAHGYPLTRAIIPAQTIKEGVVEIQVIEARYGKISLNNSSRVNDALLNATLSPLQGGKPIEQKELDASLLLLSEIPGLVTSATLLPGQMVSTSDLEIKTEPTQAVSGNVSLDNDGNKVTGRARAGGSLNFINPLHHGDVLSTSGMSSGSGMNYGRVSYETLLDGTGTRMGGAYSALHYKLGDTLATLNGHGTAQVGSLWLKHPFMRSREGNLYGQVQYDSKRLRDRIDTSGTRTDRHLDNWTASLSGDARDTFLSGGINTFNLGLISGRVSFDDAAAQLADNSTAKTQGSFSKWTANLARLQRLSSGDGLYVSFSGQWANTNLDSAEKMVAGGPYTVRAYDMGVISGDSGYLGTAEFRHDLGSIWQGQWQMIAFVDSEHVTVNRRTWTAGTNDVTLSGAGAGLDWMGQNQWAAKAYVAAPIGSKPVLLVSTNSVRGWVQVSKGF
jgi:hemolysin activation/secretion protein